MLGIEGLGAQGIWVMGYADGGKNPSQQRGSLPILQVPIRLTNVWYGRPDGVMDPLTSRG